MVESLGGGRGKRKCYGKLTMNKTNLLVSPGFLIILKTVRKLNCFSTTQIILCYWDACQTDFYPFFSFEKKG